MQWPTLRAVLVQAAGTQPAERPALQFLPESHTDFVFSVHAGWLGVLVLAVLAAAGAFLLWRLLRRRR